MMLLRTPRGVPKSQRWLFKSVFPFFSLCLGDFVARIGFSSKLLAYFLSLPFEGCVDHGDEIVRMERLLYGVQIFFFEKLRYDFVRCET